MGARRSIVVWISERSPEKRRNCLGEALRLRGQNRLPTPPAMMTAYKFMGR